MKSIVRPALAGLSVAVMMAAVAVAPAQKKALAPKGAPAPAAVGFASVEKILKPKCAGCHNAAAPAGGVNLSSYDATLKSKYKGKPVVVAKKPKDSILVKALHGDGVMKMPPGGGSLSAAEIKAFEAWIAGGAKK